MPAGSLLRTGPRSSAQITLADGTALALDHDTELQLAGGSRRARLSHGALVLDVGSKAGARAQLDVNEGALDVKAGKVALRAGSDFAILDVVRGSATLTAGGASPLHVSGGEEARLYTGAAPYVSAGATLAEAVAFTDSLLDANESAASARGLGELTARKPGSTEELRDAVKLAAHRVRVRIAGAMARTEIDEVFENSSDDVLEGIYRFPIPADAKIERLALEVDGKLEEGAFVDRDRAAAIWRGAIVNAAPSMRPQIKDDIVWVPGPWRDPALLEWQRGGRFELKIFPIPKHGQRRIVLAYTEAVRPVGGVRHFSYPLPVDPGGTTKIRHFDVDVEVRGQDPKFAVRTLGYPLSASDRDGARAFSFSADDFTPNGDLSIEWALPERQSELSAFGYRAGDERYALLTLRPKLPRATVDQAHATVIVVDTSRSMFGEGLERAKRLAVRLARELDPAGPVTVLGCDSTCRELPGGFLTPGPASGPSGRALFGRNRRRRRLRSHASHRHRQARARGRARKPRAGHRVHRRWHAHGRTDSLGHGDLRGARRARRLSGAHHGRRGRQCLGPRHARRARARRWRLGLAVRARTNPEPSDAGRAERDLRQRLARRGSRLARRPARGRAAEARHDLGRQRSPASARAWTRTPSTAR